MTYEELKAEAEKHGYRLIRKGTYISLKKCPKCGMKPSLWTGADGYTYRCDICGLSSERQKTVKKAKLSWNEVTG